MKDITATIVMMSITFGAAMSGVVMITFMTAYIHGYEVLVRINAHGEANGELIFLIVVFPIIIAGACIEVYKYVKGE